MLYQRQLVDRLFRSHVNGSLKPYYYYLDSRVGRKSAKEYLRVYSQSTEDEKQKIIDKMLSAFTEGRNVFDAVLNSKGCDLYESSKDLAWLSMAHGKEEFLQYCTDTVVDYDTQQTLSRLISDCSDIHRSAANVDCITYTEKEMINDNGLYYNPVPIHVRFNNTHRSKRLLPEGNIVYKYIFHIEGDRVVHRIDDVEGVITGQCIWQYLDREIRTHNYCGDRKILETVHLGLVQRLHLYPQHDAYDPESFITLMNTLDKIRPSLEWME